MPHNSPTSLSQTPKLTGCFTRLGQDNFHGTKLESLEIDSLGMGMGIPLCEVLGLLRSMSRMDKEGFP